ncbi:DNA polymerase subunit gamma-2, mitochondrial isoform X2 [Zerene cesonia]|uniref:DNA polymerase subunit gamma-2, mitochondrial isoform X2 n=1 Tax=Zerene cesonia TaxID=33412 RepID=UPI0018E53D14|nr:DNA polymerase subunit gamma-2, mitochondrial isoform X2 [Zerene cesonia]
MSAQMKQWQRYRKYWWSSTTTTPSLFAVKDMTHGPSTIDTQIVAKFHDNEIIVENVSISTVKNLSEHTAILTCSMSLETALCTLLLDGVLNKTTNGYLRLHNKMAPYKISFALNCQDSNNQQILEQLATLIYSKLNARHISTLLSNFSLPLQAQIEENLERGVTYTAILSDDSLKNGIFQLLNSSTMLKEQVHLSDFEDYASLICSK